MAIPLPNYDPADENDDKHCEYFVKRQLACIWLDNFKCNCVRNGHISTPKIDYGYETFD